MWQKHVSWKSKPAGVGGSAVLRRYKVVAIREAYTLSLIRYEFNARHIQLVSAPELQGAESIATRPLCVAGV